MNEHSNQSVINLDQFTVRQSNQTNILQSTHFAPGDVPDLGASSSNNRESMYLMLPTTS